MLKINFISYVNPFKKGFIGGGERITRHILSYGKSLGHDIKVAYRESSIWDRIFMPSFHLHSNPDLWILCDIFNIPSHKLYFPKGFIEGIVNSEKFIHFDNAYVDVCSRDSLPCDGIKLDLCKSCHLPFTREFMYKNSLSNFFLSPMHSSVINNYYLNKYLSKSYIVDPFADTNIFYNKYVERDIDYIYVGTISKYKGYENIKKEFGHVGDSFCFVGPKNKDIQLFSKDYRGILNEYQIADLLNRSKNFVHLPSWKEPMARTVIEAALCGCDLILNENVGAKSFTFSLSDPTNYLNSENKFWNKISNLCY